MNEEFTGNLQSAIESPVVAFFLDNAAHALE
jgi:hypothetical protein